MRRDRASRERARTAAVLLAIDAVSAEVAERLEAGGVGCILLKGPALVEMLYPDGSRTYEDCDLLVDPRRMPEAEAILRDMGFRPDETPPAAPTLAPAVSMAWARGWQRVDLHRSFWGLTATPEEVWAVLAADAVPGVVARRELLMPSRPARLLLVALHAVHHGRGAPQPLTDLARGFEQEPGHAWAEAHLLARRLRGERAFAAAFTLLPAGREVARAAGVPFLRTIEAAVTAAGLPVSEGFERLARTQTLSARLRLARDELFPSAEFMRWRYSLARRGAAGLAIAYPLRVGAIAVSVGRVALAWLSLR
jgi:hypothetical protein